MSDEERGNELIEPLSSAGTESGEAWRLYVLENHILQDDEEESNAANYWHKLDDETQGRYLRRIRDAKQNSKLWHGVRNERNCPAAIGSTTET